MSRSSVVLVVEDDYDVRDALIDVLDEAGYTVVGAADGREAIETLRKGLKPAVILLDLMMPRMDGFAFRAEQQSDPSLAEIPVVVLTADRGLGGGEELHANAYVAKPAKIQDLLEVVGRFAAA
jgi:CheY-like chemotaxis protein